jgi:hypothetical protein
LPFFCFFRLLGQAAPQFARNAAPFWLRFHNQHRKHRISDLSKCRTESSKLGLKTAKNGKNHQKTQFFMVVLCLFVIKLSVFK